MQVQEVWEEGQAHHQISAKLQAIAQQKEEIEAARKVNCLCLSQHPAPFLHKYYRFTPPLQLFIWYKFVLEEQVVDRRR